MSGNRVIRPLKATDRDELERILNTIAIFSSEERSVAMELIDATIHASALSGYVIFVSVEADKVTGYYCVGKRPLTDAVYDLYWIVVDAENAGKGTGTELLHHAEEFIEKNGGRWLLAETSSRAAYEKTRNFYIRNGYEAVARINDFYSPGDALVVYGKNFLNKN